MSGPLTAERETLSGRLHKPVKIVLRSKALSGYEWRPTFNSAALRLVGRQYRSRSRLFGASSEVVFKFEPLKPGKHGITFDLVRPIEGRSVDKKAFALHVT
jgi:hypothetical protein